MLALGYMSAHPVQEEGMGAYRIAWMALMGTALGIAYYVGHRQELDVKRTILLMLLIIGQLALNHAIISLREILPGEISYGQMLLVFPYAFAPALATALLGRKLGVFVAACTSLFGAAIMPSDCPMRIVADYLLLSMLAGCLNAILCDSIRKRENIVFSGFETGALVFVVAITLGCFNANGLVSVREGFDLTGFAVEAGAAVGTGFLVAVFVGGVMPLLEKVFTLSTHINWSEWKNSDHELLNRLQEEAPHTYDHSCEVARLAEAAARAVGADATCAGACALFHDIGKLDCPENFTENMPDKANAPFNSLTPEAKARIIIGHVKIGAEMAREYNLHPLIIDVISEHHGVDSPFGGQFYKDAMASYEAAKAKFDEGSIDTCPERPNEADFHYEGPIPHTRESSIVSMADAVESAVRSLGDADDEAKRKKIDDVFNGRIKAGHLNNSMLTLGDIKKIKESFFKTLVAKNHSRIKYPDQKKEEELPAQETREQTGSSAGSDNVAVEGSAKMAS